MTEPSDPNSQQAPEPPAEPGTVVEPAVDPDASAVEPALDPDASAANQPPTSG
ncbi:MAG: hypothetical protein ACJ74U_19225 [Jatrophihabitantaceae bacterium]